MREKDSEKIEVHVAGICIRDGKVLCGKRTAARQLYPGKWECGGGRLREGESFEEACKRQFREEFGIDVEPRQLIGTYFIEENGFRIPGVKFVCAIVGDPKPVADPNEHSEIAFVPLADVGSYDFISGIPADIEKAVACLKGE